MPMQKCCDGSRKYSVEVIGVISIVAMIATLIILIIFYTTQDDKIRNDTRKAVILGLVTKENEKEFAEKCIRLAKTMWTIGICSSCAMLISSILIIIGSRKESRKLILPWLVFCIIHYCVIIAFYIFEIIAMAKDPTDTTTAGKTIISLQIIVCTGLFVYMWIVVYSHYVVLKEENARGQYDKTTYRAS